MIDREQVIAYNRQIKEAIKTILADMNNGQRKKLVKNPVVKALLDRYKIDS